MPCAAWLPKVPLSHSCCYLGSLIRILNLALFAHVIRPESEMCCRGLYRVCGNSHDELPGNCTDQILAHPHMKRFMDVRAIKLHSRGFVDDQGRTHRAARTDPSSAPFRSAHGKPYVLSSVSIIRDSSLARAQPSTPHGLCSPTAASCEDSRHVCVGR